MDNQELERVLNHLPVTVCSADELRVNLNEYVICNTDNSRGNGKHWVTFHFPKKGAREFFDSMGNPPDFYRAGFPQRLRVQYKMNTTQIQQSESNVCGLYAAFYVIQRHLGSTMEAIVSHFDPPGQKSE